MSTPAMLGPYPIERELGRGGMGVVYLGRDPKLDRLVAIKVVPPALAMNPDNLARFEREAKMLAMVNHPNIAAIYAVEEAEGQRLLVMEYVAGDTLSERLARGPLPIDAALDINRQIAAAIEAAHEAGIVHRDLKPGNVKITPDDTVKVLDFGLAKGGAASSTDLAQSPTLTYSPTAIGVILGTAGYMSPEQTRGKPVDRRTDVWAFGCVLFESLTGRKTFEGETVSDTIARIIEREPAWDQLPASTPPRVRELLRRCLDKDLKKRQRDMGDVRIELDEALAARSSSIRASSSDFAPAPAARTPLMPRIVAAALFVAIGAAAGIGVWSLMSGSQIRPAAPISVSINIPSSIRPLRITLLRNSPALLVHGHPRRPDGSEDPVAQIYRRPFESFDLTPIPGSEGAEWFTLSPDERSMIVRKPVSIGSADRRLMKLALDDSSAPIPLGDWDREWEGAIWLSDGDLLIRLPGGSKLARLPTGGGSLRDPIALKLEGNASGFPEFAEELPGGVGVLMNVETWGPRGYRQDVWLLDAKTGHARRLVENGSRSEYQAETGYLLFSRQTSLMAVRLNLATLKPEGELISLFDGLRSASWGHGNFRVARDGHLLFQPGGRVGGDRRIVTVAPNREVTPFVADARAYEEELDVSANGQHVAVIVPTPGGTFETWTATLDRPGVRRVLALPNADAGGARWSPNGEWLAYTRLGRDASDGVYVARSDGSGQHRLLMRFSGADQWVYPTSWSVDNSGVFVTRFSNGRGDVLYVPIGAAGDAEPLAARSIRATAASEFDPYLAPDGTLLAFVSDESSQLEVYVAPFANGAIAGQPLMVSRGGGDHPRWSLDSRRLFYRREQRDRVLSVTIDRAPSLAASAPVVAFDLPGLRLDDHAWSIVGNDRLIGVQRSAAEDDVASRQIILNWLDTVRARLPLAVK